MYPMVSCRLDTGITPSIVSVPKLANASPSPTLIAEPVLLPDAFMLGQNIPVACPPLGLHPVVELVCRKPANSERLARPSSTAPASRSVVTIPEVALHYALGHMTDYDVILWFHAADTSLEDAHPQNRVRLLQWLQRTRLCWLLIYDNVESANVLQEFSPVAKKGPILLTSRKYVFAMQPASGSIEVLPFSVNAGIHYILGIISRQPMGTMVQTKEYLGGHPLALTQASSLAWRRQWRAKKLLENYIQHVYALRPSDSFCVLLRNASWHCVEIHNTKELGPTVRRAIDAARLTGFVDREPRHYAQLCNCASRLWAQRGSFDKALELMLE
ncbi:hypothetical protein B0H67DRAFT_644396 [Lasiosphaeris hirsuta]|uniref:Uncharacterized protein n=1 Tax=Lasiosphaeris hirsuta TaxID=260670 RepID=A0AA40DVC2_9PEZI|nr:hypothetical protein B0H67DRAFT_644396 [Lasiosphaeris hirsuta]